ncbi:MAG: HAD family hydrolase [Planctomycetota bacterium]
MGSPIKLIVCDNDGCLLPEGPVPLDPNMLAPIAAYNRAAADPSNGLPMLTICTGRPVSFVELELRLIHCATLPSICEHGALTYSLHDNITEFDPSITRSHRDMLRIMEDWMRDDLNLIIQAGKHGMISAYEPDEIKMRRVMAALKDRVQTEGWPLHVERSVFYINVTLQHVSKGTALARLFQRLKVSGTDVLAIGDTRGDLPMREVCGHFGAPANAVDDLKKIADYVSPHELTAGVVDIIQHFTGCSDDVFRTPQH